MRIRSIKPEFWRSDDISALDLPTRLLFIGLWSYVDDNGVGDARLASVTADLFAHDLSADPAQTLRRVSEGLDALEDRGLIVRFEGDGRPLLFVTKWDEHQLVRNPSKGHDYPLPSGDSLKPTPKLRRPSADSAQTLRTGAGEQGNRGTGDTSPQRGDGAFAEFYLVYPRKVAKDAARRAFERAVQRADAAVIISGARKFASDPNLPLEKQFIPHPATWLNAGRWDDEPLPPRSSGGAPPPPDTGFDAGRDEWMMR